MYYTLGTMQVKAFNIFRTNLRRVMAEKGVTQEQLAERLGTKHPAISRILNGHRCPKLEACEKIADAIGVSLSDLLKNPKEFSEIA